MFLTGAHLLLKFFPRYLDLSLLQLTQINIQSIHRILFQLRCFWCSWRQNRENLCDFLAIPMLSEQAYSNGRFSVPPRFDFKWDNFSNDGKHYRILPLKSRKVTVVSLIGECDAFPSDDCFIHLSGSRYGEKSSAVRSLFSPFPYAPQRKHLG